MSEREKTNYYQHCIQKAFSNTAARIGLAFIITGTGISYACHEQISQLSKPSLIKLETPSAAPTGESKTILVPTDTGICTPEFDKNPVITKKGAFCKRLD